MKIQSKINTQVLNGMNTSEVVFFLFVSTLFYFFNSPWMLEINSDE